MFTATQPRHETFQPMFIADWESATFMHFEISPAMLQPHVPFELDLWHDRAIISLVAFRQRHLRPVWGGRLAEVFSAPLADHEFLNLRTYVRHRGEVGIHFVAEWIPNRLAILLGPPLYGLPYRLGRLRYEKSHGEVVAGKHQFAFRILPHQNDYAPTTAGTIDEFLVERYVAFTHHEGVSRRFKIGHVPWPQTRVDIRIEAASLPFHAARWFAFTNFLGANFSPGIHDVKIGRPERL